MMGRSSLSDFIYYTTCDRNGNVKKLEIVDSKDGDTISQDIAVKGDENFWEEINISDPIISMFIEEYGISTSVFYNNKTYNGIYRAFRFLNDSSDNFVYMLYIVDDSVNFSVLKSYTINLDNEGILYKTAESILIEDGRN